MSYKQNAFRVLGVSTDATQTTIRNAHQAFRARARLGNFQSSNDYLSSVCSLELSEESIRDAFNSLTTIRVRLTERLFWFTSTTEADKNALQQLSQNNLQEAISILESDKSITSTANLARLYHAQCIFKDRDASEANLWAKALTAWRITLENDDFWAHFIDMELESGFEPLATLPEINDLRKNSWEVIVEYSKTIAVELLENNKDEEALRHLNIMRDSGFPSSVISHAEDEVLEPLENKIQLTSDNIAKRLSESIEKANLLSDKQKSVEIKRKSCDRAYDSYKNGLLPSIEKLTRLSAEDSIMVKRAREITASCLRTISIAYHNEVDEFKISEQILKEAQNWGGDTVASERIKEDLETISAHAKQQRIWGNLVPIDHAPSMYTVNGIGTKMYGSADYDPESNSCESTLYFCVLFIPIIPLARYRVIKHDNAYTFLGKVPLKFDRWYLGMILVLAIGFGVLMISDAITNYTRSNYSESSQTENNVEESKDNDSLTSEAIIKIQIETMKEKIDKQEPELRKLSEKLKIYKRKIDSLVSKANKMENDYRLGLSVSKSEYKNTVKQHNNYVSLYKKDTKDFKFKYEQYNKLLDKVNVEIKKYNEIVKNK